MKWVLPGDYASPLAELKNPDAFQGWLCLIHAETLVQIVRRARRMGFCG